MKTIIKKSLQSLLFVPVLALGISTVAPLVSTDSVFAAGLDSVREGVDSTGQGNDTDPGLFGSGGIFQTIVNTLLFIIGAVAVVMLVYGGFRYVTSAGDSSAVTSAKNTILYAVVGIVVAALAYAAVDFVIDKLGGE